MKSTLPNYLYISIFTLLAVLSGTAHSQQAIKTTDTNILSGHFSREGNNENSAESTGNNIYIKLYPEQWIAILYVPYPYAKTVNSNTINKVFNKVKRQSESGSFTRSTYDLLEEAATAHVEKYEIVEGQLQFQCGSINPCAVKFSDSYLELIKSGVINEHIIKFDHITE